MTQTQVSGLELGEILRRHFEPTLEMLRRAIEECPEDLWVAEDAGTPFWQYAYHTVFWADFWMSDSPEGFEAPSFHMRDALLESGEMPSVTFARQQVEDYLGQVHAKCVAFFDSLTLEDLVQGTEFFGRTWITGDRVVAQIRHIPHHVGHMNCILARRTGRSPKWVGFNE